MQYITRETGYYLPLNYNDNKIILLVRDPYCLFVYWEISNDKRENFINQFGYDAWNNSKPVLKITNVTLSTVEYLEINDFTSNWYINVNNPNCIFNVEIGRFVSSDFFIQLATSNSVHTPSSKPSKETTTYFANYKDLRTMRKVKIKTDLGKYQQEKIEPRFGLSSAQLSNMGPSSVSSESFIK